MCPRPANARPLHVVRFAASWGWDPLVSSNHPSTPHRPAHAVSSNLPSTPHRPAHAVSSNLLGANACRALNRRALATRRHAWRNLLGMGSARVYPCMAGLVTGLARAGAMHHRHWYEVDIPMTVYRYEDLVENPMFVLEKALKSSGLWAKCTSFFLLFFLARASFCSLVAVPTSSFVCNIRATLLRHLYVQEPRGRRTLNSGSPALHPPNRLRARACEVDIRPAIVNGRLKV